MPCLAGAASSVGGDSSMWALVPVASGQRTYIYCEQYWLLGPPLCLVLLGMFPSSPAPSPHPAEPRTLEGKGTDASSLGALIVGPHLPGQHDG